MNRFSRAVLGSLIGAGAGWSLGWTFQHFGIRHWIMPEPDAQLFHVGIGAGLGLAMGLWGWHAALQLFDDLFDSTSPTPVVEPDQVGGRPATNQPLHADPLDQRPPGIDWLQVQVNISTIWLVALLLWIGGNVLFDNPGPVLTRWTIGGLLLPMAWWLAASGWRERHGSRSR